MAIFIKIHLYCYLLFQKYGILIVNVCAMYINFSNFIGEQEAE